MTFSKTIAPRAAEYSVLPAESAAEAMAGLAPGCRLVGVTKGQFSMIDLIKAILQKTGPAELTLSTWTAGIRDVDNIGFLVERGLFSKLRLITDRTFPARNPSYCSTVESVFGADSIRLTNIHAKFAMLRNSEWSIVVRSSMNLNRNTRWEQYDLDDDPAMYVWFDDLVADIWATVPSGLSQPSSVVQRGFHRQGGGKNVAPSSAIASMLGRLAE